MESLDSEHLRTQNPSMKQTRHHFDEVLNRAPGKHSKFARGERGGNEEKARAAIKSHRISVGWACGEKRKGRKERERQREKERERGRVIEREREKT